jgi:hypothetical protein
LTGTHKSIEEVAIGFKDSTREIELSSEGSGPRMTILCQPQAGVCHEILKVTIKGGRAYAVDIAGAQFGVYEPVWPWDKYAGCHIQSVEYQEEFGARKKVFIIQSGKKRHALAEALLGNQRIVVSDLETRFGTWLSKHNVSVTKLLKMQKQEHMQILKNMSDTLIGGMQDFIEEASKSKDFVVAVERGAECEAWPQGRVTFVFGDGAKRYFDELRMEGLVTRQGLLYGHKHDVFRPKEEWEKMPSEEGIFAQLRSGIGGRSISQEQESDEGLREFIHKNNASMGLLGAETRKWPRDLTSPLSLFE